MLHPPPHKDILAQFEAGYMAGEIELLYEEAIAAGGFTAAGMPLGVSTAIAPADLDRLEALTARTVELDLAEDASRCWPSPRSSSGVPSSWQRGRASSPPIHRRRS